VHLGQMHPAARNTQKFTDCRAIKNDGRSGRI
jgi:hypothetical protein